MRFNRQTEYGIRALVHLAEHAKGQPYSLKEISQKEDISFSFLEKIFSQLKKAHIVNAQKGAAGGYLLAKPIDRISIKEVLDALGESITPYECFVTPDEKPKLHCKSHVVWSLVQKQMIDSLSKITLKDISGTPA